MQNLITYLLEKLVINKNIDITSRIADIQNKEYIDNYNDFWELCNNPSYENCEICVYVNDKPDKYYCFKDEYLYSASMYHDIQVYNYKKNTVIFTICNSSGIYKNSADDKVLMKNLPNYLDNLNNIENINNDTKIVVFPDHTDLCKIGKIELKNGVVNIYVYSMKYLSKLQNKDNSDNISKFTIKETADLFNKNNAKNLIELNDKYKINQIPDSEKYRNKDGEAKLFWKVYITLCLYPNLSKEAVLTKINDICGTELITTSYATMFAKWRKENKINTGNKRGTLVAIPYDEWT